MSTTRLSAIESAYLAAERPETPLHVASIGFFEGAPFFADGQFRLDEIRVRVAARLGALPRLRQRVLEVPLDLGRPVWADDDAFDIARHVEVLAVPAPGDEHAVLQLLTEVYMQPLDRAHPLWHLLFMTGLSDGRVALVQRAHHALVDGVGGVGLATVLLDLAREPQPDTAYPPVTPVEATPDALDLLVDAVTERATQPARLAGRGLRAVVTSPGHAAEIGKDLAASLTGASGEGWRAPTSSLNQPVTAARRVVFLRSTLDEFMSAGKPHAATVNDVVLATVTAGLRALLLARGEFLSSDAVLKTLVPVSTRPAEDAAELGNQVGGMMVALPIGIGDPLERLMTVAQTTKRLKAAHEDLGSAVILAAADLLPPRLLHAAHAAMLHQPFVNIVVTNVPGPPFPLYAMGAEMLEAFPLVPIYGNLPIGVAVLSYNGALNFGFTIDPQVSPDADVFVDAVRNEIATLNS